MEKSIVSLQRVSLSTEIEVEHDEQGRMLVTDLRHGREFYAQLFVMPGDCKGPGSVMASVYTFAGCVDPFPWDSFYEEPIVEKFAESHVRVTHRYNLFSKFKK